MADDQHSQTACGWYGRRQHIRYQNHFLKLILSVNTTVHRNHEIINQQQRTGTLPLQSRQSFCHCKRHGQV